MGNCLCFKRKISSRPVEEKSEEELKALGNEQYKEGNFNEAVEFYTRAIKKNMSKSIYYSNRALCYFKLKNFSYAALDGEAAYKLDENNIKALVMCIKSNASLALAGDIAYFEHSLQYCKKLKTFSKAHMTEVNAIYCKELKKKIKRLFNVIQRNQKKARVKEYYRNRLPKLHYEKMEKFLGSKEQTFESLMCPLTIEIFSEPVVVSSGNTYEKSMINTLVAANNNIDPLTRKSINKDAIYVNQAVKKAVEWFSLKYPDTAFGKDGIDNAI